MGWEFMGHVFSKAFFSGTIANIFLAWTGVVSPILVFIFFYYPHTQVKMKNLALKAKPFMPWVFAIFMVVSILIASNSIYDEKNQQVAVLQNKLEQAEKPFSPPEELTGSHLSGLRIRVVDLAINYALITNKVFDDCEFFGPAVVQFQEPFQQGTTLTVELALGDTVDSVFISTPNDTFTGVIAFKNCIFNNCYFMHVGIIAKPDVIDAIKSKVKYIWP